MNTLCIYHKNCDDGFGAAWAVWKKLGNDAEYLGANYGDAQRPCVRGRDVIMVDFSYKRSVLEGMGAEANSITILDHHKTAQADLEIFIADERTMRASVWEFTTGASINGQLPIRALFDMERSGARMAWDHFHPNAEEVPLLIQYIEDRDLWYKRLPGSDEFTIALRSYPQDFEVWDSLSVRDLIAEGRAIQRYYRARVDDLKPGAGRAEIGGHVVPVINGPGFMASELAGELSEGHPFAACYFDMPDKRVYSLRSRAPDGIDVSEVAKKYGGGGHKHAAGFTVPRP